MTALVLAVAAVLLVISVIVLVRQDAKRRERDRETPELRQWRENWRQRHLKDP